MEYSKKIVSLRVIFLLLLFSHTILANSRFIKEVFAEYSSNEYIKVSIQVNSLFSEKIKKGFLVLNQGSSIIKYDLKKNWDQSLIAMVPLKVFTNSSRIYFQFLDTYNQMIYYPEIQEGERPLNPLDILPDDELQVEIISPEPNSQILPEDASIVVSYLAIKDKIDAQKTQILFDNLDVSKYVEKYEDFFVFNPPRIRPGWHNVKVVFFSPRNQILGTRSFSFEVIEPNKSTSYSTQRKNYSGRFFINNRYESFQDNAFNKDFFYTGLKVQGTQNKLSWGINLLVSNQESSRKQPVNQYGAHLKYSLQPDIYLDMKIGDAFPYYDDLFFFGQRNRGIQTSLKIKFFSFDFIKGMLKRDIEGSVDTQGNILAYGIYKREMTGFIPAFHITSHATTKFYFLHFKDVVNSIEYGLNPEENAILGISQSFNADQNRIYTNIQFATSLFNRNIKSGNIPFDTVKNYISDLSNSDKKYYDLAKKFITVNENLIFSLPYALKAQLHLNYFKNRFMAQYQYIMESFQNLGNPFLLRDIKGITLRDNMQLVTGKLFLTLNYENLQTNFQDENQNPTHINTFGGMLSFYPGEAYPSLSLGVNSSNRNNNTDFQPGSFLFAENNKNTSLNFSTNYNFITGNIKNNVTLTFINYLKDDKISSLGKTSGQAFNSFIRTLWNTYFYTQLNIFVNNNELAQNDPQFGTQMKNSTLGLLISYKRKNIFANENNEFIVRTSYNTNDYTSASNKQRINKFISGLSWYMDLAHKGRFYLSGSLIQYSKDITGKDLQFFTGYEMNF